MPNKCDHLEKELIQKLKCSVEVLYRSWGFSWSLKNG